MKAAERLLYIIVIVSIFIMLLLQRACNKCPGSVTVVKHDTQWLKHDTTITTAPQPVAENGKKIEKTKKVTWPNILVITDTFVQEVPKVLTNAEMEAIKKKYFSSFSYSDTNKYEFGYSVLREEVTQNRITYRQWENHSNLPIVTNTKTVNKGVLYIGFNLYGNKTDLLNGVGPELLWKTKNNQIYKAGIVYNSGGIVSYEVGMMWPIRLKK